MRSLLTALVLATSTLAAAPAAMAADGVIAVGAGEVTGFHYPVAGAVCRLVNKDRQQHGLHCLVEPTGGSGANVAGLKNGLLQLAVVQSKAASQAVAGNGPFKELGAVPELRSLFSLYSEGIALVVRKDSRVRQLSDLKGKRINLGRPGSYQRTMADALLEAMGWTQADFAAALEIEPGRQARALCEGQLDAAVFAGVHPIAEVQTALEDCGGMLLPLKGAAIDNYLKKSPYLARLSIKDVYRRAEDEVPTFGTMATLVTTKAMSDEDAYRITKAVFEHFDAFTAQYPVLSDLDKKTAAHDGLAAPLHDGAQKYFSEAGLR